MGPPLLFVVLLYTSLVAMAGNMVNKTVEEPYMDEFFHVRQTQAYCAGNFSQWDEKITTLPGLYLISLGLLQPLHSVSSWWGRNYHLLTGDTTSWPPRDTPLLDICTTPTLRTVNLVFSLLNLLLLTTLTSQIHGGKDYYSPNMGLWSSVNMAIMPVLQFSSLLYYTDPASTSLVLLLFSLHLANRHCLSAAAGILAVLLRQTNIIWVLLVGAKTAGDLLLEDVRQHQAETKIPPYISLLFVGQLEELVVGVRDFLKCSKRLLNLLVKMLPICGGYLTTGLLFAVFVYLNQGIVVGDRTAHEAVIHIPQIFYFSIFTAGLALPFSANKISGFLHFVRRHLLSIFLLSIAMAAVISCNTLAHPYLLADNRHYTFYIWRKIFMRHWAVKYIMIPCYIFSVYCVARTLERTGVIFKLSLPVCLVLSLVPQKLLEFRYFILPFLLTRLQERPVSWVMLGLETCLLLVINVITVYIFIYKPFVWEQEPDVLQRFMW